MPATWNVLFHRNLYNSFYTDIIPTLLIFCMKQGQDLALQTCFVLESLILQVPKLLDKNTGFPQVIRSELYEKI